MARAMSFTLIVLAAGADCAENILVSLAGAIRDLLDKVQRGELEYDPS